MFFFMLILPRKSNPITSFDPKDSIFNGSISNFLIEVEAFEIILFIS